jgi:hypothetical protein
MRRTALPLALLLVAGTTLAADKSEVINQTFPSRPGKVVLIDAGALDLFVRAADIGEIRVHAELDAGSFKASQSKAWIDAHRPTIEDSEGELRIVAPDPGGVKLFKGVIVSKARMEIVLPLSVRPDLSTTSAHLRVEGEFGEARPLRLRSASGNIDFQGWAPHVEIRTTSGNATLKAPRAFERLMARSASGIVALTGGARSVRCDTSSGAVSLAGLLGPAGIVTTSGDITLVYDAIPPEAEVKLSSASGRIRLTLPPGSQPGGEVASVRGEIRSVYPGTAPANEPRLKLSGAAPKLTINTTSGKIELL